MGYNQNNWEIRAPESFHTRPGRKKGRTDQLSLLYWGKKALAADTTCPESKALRVGSSPAIGGVQFMYLPSVNDTFGQENGASI